MSWIRSDRFMGIPHAFEVWKLKDVALGMAAAAAPATHQLAALAPTAAASEPTGFCLFAYNLSPDTEDSLLWQLFGPFGAVLSVKVGSSSLRNYPRF